MNNIYQIIKHQIEIEICKYNRIFAPQNKKK